MVGRPEAPERTLPVQRLGVVGLGLIGGSIAQAARAAIPSLHVVGVDRQVILDVATDQGLIDQGVALEQAGPALAGCDLVVFCLPVLQIIEVLDRLKDDLRQGPVLTDTGSTKNAVMEAAEAADLPLYVGGHPMAGKAQGGLAHADAGLFRGATWFVCPHPQSDEGAVARVRAFVAELGARPVELDAQEHDLAVALTSQVPHVVVNALAETVLDDGALDSAGGSLRLLLQIAGAPVETWQDTLRTNQAAVRESLRRFADHLLALSDELDDKERVKQLFAKGRACRERLLS